MCLKYLLKANEQSENNFYENEGKDVIQTHKKALRRGEEMVKNMYVWVHTYMQEPSLLVLKKTTIKIYKFILPIALENIFKT